MNRETATRLLPVLTAFAAGRPIQHLDSDGVWRDAPELVSFVHLPDVWRVKPAEPPKLPTTVDSWQIDGKPVPWGAAFRVDAVNRIGKLETRTVVRGSERVQIRLFVVGIEGTPTEIACCRELSNPVCLGEQKLETENLRDTLVLAMALYADRADRAAALLQAQVKP
jgi:hypothetical protein